LAAIVGDHFYVQAPVTLEYGNMDFGAASNGCHIRAFHPAIKITAIGTGYTITGGAVAHLLLLYGVFEQGSATYVVTVSGTPTFSSAFVDIDNNAKVNWAGAINGAGVIGKRFDQKLLTLIRVGTGGAGGGGINFFPGNAPGTTLAGGGSVYA
jgi:hypothetical protein